MLKNNSRLIRAFTIIFLIVLAVVAIVSIGMFLLQAPDHSNQQLARFVVNKGESVTSIGAKLQEQGLIKNKLAFRLYYKVYQDQYQIQAGSFELSPAMDVKTILQTLGEGTDDLWVTLPEGLRREEMAASLAAYPLLYFDEAEFLTQTIALEGQLFPDTYLVPKEITTQALVKLMNNTFEKRIAPFEKEFDQSQYSFIEILTMASLIEREGRTLEEMKAISGILWKRLELGMALQVDATLQYAKGYDEVTGGWWTTPLAQDKTIDSRYNTYLNPGLPPNPICNPGLNAIEAAVRPTVTDNLFYLHDNQGQIHFAQNLDQHNQNVNKYLR